MFSSIICRSYLIFVLVAIVGVIGQYEWQPRDAFDEIKIRVEKVTPDNCPIQHAGDLYLPEDTVSHKPDIKESRFIRPAINDNYDPGMMYYFLSTVADVSANPYINGSAIYFSPNNSYTFSYRGFFNKTFPRFALRTFRLDDFNDPIHLQKISTMNTFEVKDLGAIPKDAYSRDYTSDLYKINEWYKTWLPDGVEGRHDSKTTYQVEIRYANNTNETFTFHGPPGADEDPGPVKFTRPYFDCKRANKWLVSAVVLIADIYPRHTQFRHIEYPKYTAIAVLEMDFDRIDINQCECPKGEGNNKPNRFVDTARCKMETTECEPLHGWGFRSGGYQCRCRPGYRLPSVVRRPYLGEVIERASAEQYYNGYDCLRIGSHKLNLVIVDSCARVSSATDFFNTLEALYVHFSQPGNHARIMKVHDTLGIRTGHEMGSLSSTRWSCRYENCKAVLNNYDVIKDVLEEEISQARDKNSVEALGILTCITKPDFIVSLFAFHSVLLIANVLSKYFQSKDATLGRASEIITGIIANFEEKRNKFDDLWNEIKNFAEKRKISLEPIRVSKKRKQPERLNDFLTESTLGKSNLVELPSDTKPSEYWKINIYYRMMDNIISNFKYRFENIPLAQSVDSFMKLDLDNGEAFVANYKDVMKIDISVLHAETVVIKNILKSKSVGFNLENLKIEIKKDFTPNLYRLLQVAIGLPVSSAGCERSFSAMRRIKTWLRTTMNQERFSNMALLNIENTMIKHNVTAQQVLEVFAKKHRKLRLI